MTLEKLGNHYQQLSKLEKGKLTLYLTIQFGDSQRTWQNRFLHWANGTYVAPVSNLIMQYVERVIQAEEWR